MNEPIEVKVEGGTQRRRGGGGGFLMVPGIAFLALGVAVLVWPTVLQIMVAALFIMIGLGLLFGASRVNRVRKTFAQFDTRYPPGD